MNDSTRENPTTEAEKAMFQRFLHFLSQTKGGAVDGAGAVAAAAVDVAGNAAANVSYAAGAVAKVAGDAASQIAGYAKNGAELASEIVKSRRSGQEPIAQLLFRVPESLRDEVKRLALDEKRKMDELLTEAVLDLLNKYGRLPKAIEKLRLEQND